ncbi:MAG: hypothetical protein DRP78_06565, partial [Candidatus Omnitrophota bacterium]
TWTSSTDNVWVSGYKVYRDDSQIGTSTTTNYSDTGLTANTSYSYRLSAYDAAGNDSGQCTAVSAATPQVSDTTAPIRTNGLPAGELSSGTTSTDISLSTDENATCKYSQAAGTSYANMTDFTNTTGTNHTTEVSGLENGLTYNYYVKCKDESDNINSDDYVITFSVADTLPVNNTSSSGGNCFIATAAYGTPMAEEVKTLSRFRDKYLLTNYCGKTFVNLYYKYSPKMANYLRHRNRARSVVRLMLSPLVNLIR